MGYYCYNYYVMVIIIIIVHRYGAGGSMSVCHAEGPCSMDPFE